jgi:hypothetical protein
VRALWNLVGVGVKQAPKAENGFSMVKAKKKSVAPKARETTKKKVKKAKVKTKKR